MCLTSPRLTAHSSNGTGATPSLANGLAPLPCERQRLAVQWYCSIYSKYQQTLGCCRANMSRIQLTGLLRSNSLSMHLARTDYRAPPDV